MTPLPVNYSATRKELAAWLTVSRNLVAPCLARMGILPLAGKYPMSRIYTHLLGITPAGEEEQEMLAQGLVRISKVAERFGRPADDLLQDVRDGKGGYPPLYALGPRQHMFLRAQIDQMVLSPRNAWHAFSFVENHTLTARALASVFSTSKDQLDHLLDEGGQNLPAHLILKGKVRFIVADVRGRLVTAAGQKSEPQLEVAPLTLEEPAGLISRVRQIEMKAASQKSGRPRSCSSALKGDCAHDKTSEAKLSET